MKIGSPVTVSVLSHQLGIFLGRIRGPFLGGACQKNLTKYMKTIEKFALIFCLNETDAFQNKRKE